ncbi:hypothetical protein [Rhizobium ruizarguesonis]|uniref:hypothetical protein n=1 Tax=Rhizobium ruizarguesonis TaxID=2081791 RepID=UPI00102F7F75|nr:hypothetical protein [Rhizobium ruizarguesonis]TAW62745.1 hypothetical protein ELI16_31135 [Rhizobium ruizarguesonis]TAW81893.1 hypothetical protein ELI11_29870 [Rhizobium ruizarguesonis]
MAVLIMLLAPAIAFFWTAWQKFEVPFPAEPLALGLTGLGEIVVNASCVCLLAAFRQAGARARRRLLSTRNDAIANTAIIAAGVLALYVALATAQSDRRLRYSLDAANEVWAAAQEEHQDVA